MRRFVLEEKKKKKTIKVTRSTLNQADMNKHSISCVNLCATRFPERERERERDRQTDRQTDRHTDRDRDRETERERES